MSERPTDRADRPRWPTFVALGLIAGAITLFEIALTRIFSFTIWHHFTFMVSFPTRLDPAGSIKSPSFVSPEQTWRSFLAAIEAGDRGAAAACLTPTALENLGSDLETFPVDEMRRMVGTFTRIESDGDLGPFWSIHGVREGERPKWLFFEETVGGEWKIAGI